MLLGFAGCGDGDSGLSRAEVTSIPPGDAQGTQLSGRYSVEVYTSHCSGECSWEFIGLPIGVCEVGERETEDFDAIQNDGALRFVGDGDATVDTLEGGIDRNGAFDLGGYGADDEIEQTIRLTGEMSAAGEIEGDAESRIYGDADGEIIDCRGTYVVSGGRIAD